MYKFWPGQALSMTIFSFDSQCDLVSNDIASSQGEQLCQIILKLMHNVEVMARTSSIDGHFISFDLQV